MAGTDDRPGAEAIYSARVLRAFVREGRLSSIPAKERKRRIMLRFLASGAE